MKIKCNDGIVRTFTIARNDGDRMSNGERASGNLESYCSNCDTPFGCHDTKILKLKWKKHACKIDWGNIKGVDEL